MEGNLGVLAFSLFYVTSNGCLPVGPLVSISFVPSETQIAIDTEQEILCLNIESIELYKQI